MQATTLVIGGNGKTGRRVIERLEQAGRPVRNGSRRAAIPFDWDDRATWSAALRGVQAAYITYQPDLAVPQALAAVSAFFEQAIAAGVGKLVLLSGRGEPEAQDAERALQATDADWTILRASWFQQNFSESFFLGSILAGETVLPDSLAPEPFVDVEDVADIALAALTSDVHSRRFYELTGPEAITFRDAIAQIALATGRTVAFIPVSMEQYRAELVRQQIPPEFVELVTYLFTTVLDGRNTRTADGVREALGRAPRRFSDYVRRTAASGVWGAHS